ESCWCGNVGCLETYLNQAHIESLLHVGDGETIKTALQRSYQRGTYYDIIDVVATALVAVVNMYNPQVIVLGGWIADVWPLMEGEVQQQVKRRTRFWNEPALEIRPSSFGSEVGIHGANAVALGKWVYGLGGRWEQTPADDGLDAPEETF
ncbi:MAG: ROK family protein, partial [Sulfobacillus sp.]